MAVAPDGAIVVSCKSDLFRLTPQGQLDTTFNGSGYNSIYQAGYSTDPLYSTDTLQILWNRCARGSTYHGGLTMARKELNRGN